jgi:ubiquinone/menaquinone biosynthesis C-methylase UbiE
MIKDEQYDVSLMLGPMYHLQEEKDRIKALKELKRVTKKNGLVFVAFMPRIRQILTSLLSPDNWKPNDNMDTIIQFSQSGCFNHADEGRFTGAYYVFRNPKHTNWGNSKRNKSPVAQSYKKTLDNSYWSYRGL